MNQQAQIDPELQGMLAQVAALTNTKLTAEELAKLKAVQDTEQEKIED